MSSYDEVLRQVTENLRRDEQRKAAIVAQFPHITYAMDSAALSESSGRELATRVLESYGLKVSRGTDPLEALDYYMFGRWQAQQLAVGVKSCALDGAQPNSIIARYIRGEL